MQRSILFLLLALLLVPVAHAVLGTTDTVPAATLLFPYFEVDIQNPQGVDTVLSVVNSDAYAVAINVVIWTDHAVPVARFPLYLTGYDVQRISLRDVLVNGAIPATADNGNDWADTISPQGLYSHDVNFPGNCGPVADLTAEELASIQAALTGQYAPLLGGCAGAAHGDRIARGYVTADSVRTCESIPAHSAASYYSDVLDFRNLLLGEYEIVNPSTREQLSFNAVHVEASESDPLYTESGRYTFYGRYNGFTATDRREPLGSRWALNFSGTGTDVIAWRDSKTVDAAFPCSNAGPDAMTANRLAIFDTEENLTMLDDTQAAAFPRAAGKARIGAGTLPVPPKVGWMWMNLGDRTNDDDPALPTSDPTARQSFVQVIRRPEMRGNVSPLSAGFSAVLISGVAKPSGQWDPGPSSGLTSGPVQ